MILRIGFLLLSTAFFSCEVKPARNESTTSLPIVGTWRLLSGTLIEKGDTVVTDYTKGLSFIKIINKSHFAFFSHDLKNGKDSSAIFNSGGGTYSLVDNLYTEHLEYCSAREWENHDFEFVLTLKNDTLIQHGVEIIEAADVNRLNIEKYVRMKN